MHVAISRPLWPVRLIMFIVSADPAVSTVYGPRLRITLALTTDQLVLMNANAYSIQLNTSVRHLLTFTDTTPYTSYRTILSFNGTCIGLVDL